MEVEKLAVGSNTKINTKMFAIRLSCQLFRPHQVQPYNSSHLRRANETNYKPLNIPQFSGIECNRVEFNVSERRGCFFIYIVEIKNIRREVGTLIFSMRHTYSHFSDTEQRITLYIGQVPRH
jgi:hypothetical protein